MIIFDIILYVIFTTYYDPSTPLWEVVANSMSSFCHVCHRQNILHHRSSTYPTTSINLYYQWYIRLPLVYMVIQGSGEYLKLPPKPGYWPSSALPDNSVSALPPTTGNTHMGLYVVSLVNKFHYWLTWSNNTTYIVNIFFIVQEKLPCRENSCFVCKREITSFKNHFLPCIYLVYVCKYVYHESARTCYMYMYFCVFLVIIGIDNHYTILLISLNKVYQ